ncbi:MAG: hypothetical protein J5835_02260 [Bacteroidales bacterium]|nr:hypothetical protein [Bacteroidales bacterium]
MKKLFTTILAASLMLVAFNANAQLSAGAGYINATEKVTYTNGNTSTTEATGLNGFYIGGQYDMPVPSVSGLGVNAGLYANFLFGGGHSDGFYGLGAGTTKDTSISLNIPVNATFGFDLSGDTNVFAFAGPTFQFGLVNKNVFVPDSDKSTSTTTDNYGGDDPRYNRFNLLIGGGIGAQVAGIKVVVGVDQSLLNYINVDKYSGSRFQLKIGVGYAF